MTIQEQAKLKIEKYEKILRELNNLETDPLLRKQYNYELTVSSEKSKLKVLVYFGKKGIKTILQGNPDSELYKEINSIIIDEPQFEFTKEELTEPDDYIGTDESGKGDYFGPLVIAAFYVNKETIHKLKKMGVRDSKDLSESQIISIAKGIRKNFPNFYKIVFISPKKYNELYPEFKNINKLLVWAHSKAIDELLSQQKSEIVIIDKFSKRNLNLKSDALNKNIKIYQFTKGERFTGVAAASILARERVVDWFNKKSKSGIKLPKGAAETVVNKASEIIKMHGQDKLEELVKIHFKITKKI